MGSDLKLTVKQENFCNRYVECGNASEAYRFAYDCSKMKDEAVNVQASKMLNHPKIAPRVRSLQNDLKRRSDITKDEAVKELTNIIRFRITNVLKISKETFTLNDFNSLSDEVLSSIQSIKQTSNGIEIKFYDKISAIDKLSKMLGWDAPTKSELTGKDGKPLELNGNSSHTIIFEDYSQG